MKHETLFSFMMPFVISLFVISCNQQPEKDKSITPTTTTTATTPIADTPKIAIDKNVLVGNWTRTDAEYKIKILEVLETGNLKAGYFNPKSINVGKAMWNNADGVLKVYIQLSDENYPGSYYQLIYIPSNGMLAGKYFQAVEGTTYDVAFAKAK